VIPPSPAWQVPQLTSDRVLQQLLNSSKKYLKGFWAVVGYLGIASNEPETGLRVLHGGGGTVGACHLDHVQSFQAEGYGEG
jgi:hypothetical protein